MEGVLIYININIIILNIICIIAITQYYVTYYKQFVFNFIEI